MGEHQVAFNIGTARVVCTCGADFGGGGLYGLPDAVSLWATHLAVTRGWRTAPELWDEGFSAACEEHMTQERDPSHYFRRNNPYLAPQPAPAAATEEGETA